MRGPIAGIPDLLQPVAHALLQAEEDTITFIRDIPPEKLWLKPFGNASVGFHVQHIIGVIDRMFTYAEATPLSAQQFDYLYHEGVANELIDIDFLVKDLHLCIQQAIAKLSSVDPNTLTEIRFIGRKQIPTTLIGLLFHAAEHAQRHVGQLLVTVRCQK